MLIDFVKKVYIEGTDYIYNLKDRVDWIEGNCYYELTGMKIELTITSGNKENVYCKAVGDADATKTSISGVLQKKDGNTWGQ